MNMNHFQILDLEQKYDIDLKLLKTQYLSKQALYHPDRAKSESERMKNLNISMQLNDAYKILQDDYMRAEYLVKILGQQFDDVILRNQVTQDDLEQIMELHEQLDSTDNLNELQQMKTDKLNEKMQIVTLLTKYFHKNNLTKAIDITVRLKYLTNLVKNIDLKIRNIKNANNQN